MRSGLLHRLGAEALGTLLLIYLGVGTVIAGNAGSLGVALAFALTLAVGIWIFGPVSGAHFNPWVTLAMALRGRLGWLDTVAYVLAQLVGALAGALLLWATYGDDGVSQRLLGATRLVGSASSGAGLIGAIIAEAIATFVLVAAIFALTAGDRAGNRTTGLGIGLALAAGILAIGEVTGASINFARTFGPELALAIAGGPTDWSDIWVYLVGPAIGAAGAAFAFDTVTRAPSS